MADRSEHDDIAFAQQVRNDTRERVTKLRRDLRKAFSPLAEPSRHELGNDGTER